MAYGIILLPDPVLSRRLIEYSNEIANVSSATLRLGDDAPPHVTLLHVQCELADALEWWRRAEGALNPLEIILTGLMFTPLANRMYAPTGDMYYGLEAVRTPELDLAHRAVIEVADPGHPTLGVTGRMFRHHITLGFLKDFPGYPVSLPMDLVTTTFIGRPALGRLGPHGTFPEIIERYPETPVESKASLSDP